MASGVLVSLQPDRSAELGYEELPDGSIRVPMEGYAGPEPVAAGEHAANLADTMSSSERARLGERVMEWVEADREARKAWVKRFEDGLVSAGIKTEVELFEAPFPGASTVVHPLIIEHCVQFQARALKELFPPQGPVKAGVLGRKTAETEAQAKRVEEFMNYQIVYLDPTYFGDVDQLLFWLPLMGSCFKKSYPDRDSPAFIRSVLCHPADVLVPYTANTIHDAPRITHRIKVSPDWLQRKQAQGVYSEISIPEPMDTGTTEIESSLDEAEDKERVLAEGDAPHVLYECHCEYRVGGDEFLPYIVTVEEATTQVLAVRRNWKANDPKKRKRQWFTHYRYLPGLGFYGLGIIHLMGGLGDAVTGSLRVLLDAGAFATMQGGFKSKDAKIKSDVRLEPGKYADTEMTSEELQRSFYTPPFKEPSPALVQLHEKLVEAGQRFGSTTEALVGDAKNTGPVGTTVALIEQSTQVFSGIHKRLHVAFGEEFRVRAELNAEYLPDEYPYSVQGGERQLLRADFDDRIDVVPVSDPNIYSSTQRIAIAQGELQLAQSAPEMYDTYEAHRRMLMALRSADIDTLLPNPNDIPPMDPVSEGSYLIVGKPVRAHMEEDHEAHMAVHEWQLGNMQGNPLLANAAAALQAHMAEHLALAYRLQMMQAMGIVLPALDLRGKKPEAMDPALANEIAVRAAMAVQQMAAARAEQQALEARAQAEAQGVGPDGQPLPPATAQPGEAPPPSPAAARSREQEGIRDEEMQGRIQRDRILAAAQFLNQNRVADIKPETLVATAEQLGRSFDETLALIRSQQSGGQGVGVAPEALRVNREAAPV